jgi:hypothetical protein
LSSFAVLHNIAARNEELRRRLRKLGVAEVARLIMDANFTIQEIVEAAMTVIQAVNS